MGPSGNGDESNDSDVRRRDVLEAGAALSLTLIPGAWATADASASSDQSDRAARQQQCPGDGSAPLLVRAPAVESSPTIDGYWDDGEWAEATETAIDLRGPTEDSWNLTVYAAHDEEALYLACWSVYASENFRGVELAVDGNHDGELDGTPIRPHEDVFLSQHSPAPTDFEREYRLLGNSAAVERPAGLAWASDEYGEDAGFEFRIPFGSVLPADPDGAVNCRLELRMQSGRRDEFWPVTPADDGYDDPANWASVNLKPGSPVSAPTCRRPGDVLRSPAGGTPSLDGLVRTRQWTTANCYELSFYSTDRSGRMPVRLWTMHDDEHCYLALRFPYDPGAGTEVECFVDGDHDGQLSGSPDPPHRDVRFTATGEEYALLGSDAGVCRPESLRAEVEIWRGRQVYYELQVPFDPTLGGPPDGAFDVRLAVHTDVGAGNQPYYWPVTPADDGYGDPENWGDINLKP
jgi:hypothetical protein